MCPLPLMLESCPPLTALARASVQSLLGSHKGLLRKWRPREGERLREVTQPCLPAHGPVDTQALAGALAQLYTEVPLLLLLPPGPGSVWAAAGPFLLDD